jgi:1-acyl-sn-glycerol-3-phosphate acyltransferase
MPPVNSHHSDMPHPAERAIGASMVPRLGRRLRSMLCAICYLVYLLLAMGLPQRVVIWPLVTVLPSRRRAIVRAWLQLQARATLGLFRRVANVRVSVQGAIPPASCIVLMNHQSVLDLPLAVFLVPGPYPLIPTASRYARGIPGISPLMRLARMPLLSRGSIATRRELRALRAAADQVAQGKHSFLIFPEGHRSHDGRLLPFRTSGLRLVLRHVRRPVYCAVVDGVAHTRTAKTAALCIADTDVRVVILGPFIPSADDIDGFIESLRDRMATTLAQLRATDVDAPADGDLALAR